MTDVFLSNFNVDSRYTSLSEEIRQLLLDAFVGGELIPGTRINDMELAKKLGVSRTPVREALRGLQTMGIIETLPARITRVVKLSAEEFDHVRQVWGSLYQVLLADVAGRVSKQEQQQMVELCEQLGSTTDENVQATIGFRFFGILAGLTSNTFLKESIHNAACRMRLGYHDGVTGAHHHFRITFAQAQAFLGSLGHHANASQALENILGAGVKEQQPVTT